MAEFFVEPKLLTLLPHVPCSLHLLILRKCFLHLPVQWAAGEHGLDRLERPILRLGIEQPNAGDPKQIERCEQEICATLGFTSAMHIPSDNANRTSMLPNMMGLTSTVHPTPMAQPVIPNPLPCARISEGKISVGSKNATVPQVAA